MSAAEFLVVWKRAGIKAKRKRYATEKGARRFVALLGPEPWVALGKDPDERFCCCGGPECNCGGMTVQEKSDADRKEMPALEVVTLLWRPVVEWRPYP